MRAGAIGAGALVLAPRVALHAFADGLAPIGGVWSVTVDPRGGLLAIAGTRDGPVVKRLDVDPDGLVHPAEIITGAEPGTDLLAVGLGPLGPVALGSRWIASAPPSLDDGLAVALDDEPDAPSGSDDDAVGRLAAVGLALDHLAPVAVPAHGLLTAQSGRWAVHQHGVDDEADHLDTVSLVRDGVTVASISGLGMAGLATLSGPADHPVLAVVDGGDTVHVVRDDGERRQLPGVGPAAITSDGATTLVATVIDDALVLAELTADGLAPAGSPVAGRVTDVIPVTGAPAVVAATEVGLRYIDLAGRGGS